MDCILIPEAKYQETANEKDHAKKISSIGFVFGGRFGHRPAVGCNRLCVWLWFIQTISNGGSSVCSHYWLPVLFVNQSV